MNQMLSHCVHENSSDYLSILLGFDGFKAHEVTAVLQPSNPSPLRGTDPPQTAPPLPTCNPHLHRRS